MYAITGITGQVGGIAARSLLDAGLSVRAVMCEPNGHSHSYVDDEEVWFHQTRGAF
jgi:hypothetical protein